MLIQYQIESGRGYCRDTCFDNDWKNFYKIPKQSTEQDRVSSEHVSGSCTPPWILELEGGGPERHAAGRK